MDINIDSGTDDFSFSFTSIITHISENLFGFILLLLVFFIIYIVDHINQLNSLTFSTPSAVPMQMLNNHNFMVKPKRKIKK